MKCSVRRPAAVDGQRGAGDRTSARAAQEDGERAKLLDFGKALVGLGREQHVADHLLAADAARLRGVVDLVLDQRRPDIAWADRVAGDVVLGAFQRDGLGQADDAVLRRDIGALERRGDEPVGGRDVDDPAEAVAASSRRTRRAIVYQADDRLSAMIASYFSGGKFSIGLTCWMPALLTRMSTRPKLRDRLLDQAGGLVALHQVGAVVDDAAAPDVLLELGAERARSRSARRGR